ncbi:hypothetical protein D3C73_892950 [compost metagenome]
MLKQLRNRVDPNLGERDWVAFRQLRRFEADRLRRYAVDRYAPPEQREWIHGHSQGACTAQVLTGCAFNDVDVACFDRQTEIRIKTDRRGADVGNVAGTDRIVQGRLSAAGQRTVDYATFDGKHSAADGDHNQDGEKHYGLAETPGSRAVRRAVNDDRVFSLGGRKLMQRDNVLPAEINLLATYFRHSVKNSFFSHPS